MWDWAIWAALILGTAAGIAALVLLVVRSLEAWRALREARRSIVGGLDEFAAQAEAAADKLAAADDTIELRESLGRLRLSLARLAVLRAAIDEVDDVFGRVVAVVPRK
jgi:3-deoxy-D-manno-octulosonic-acid transferase